MKIFKLYRMKNVFVLLLLWFTLYILIPSTAAQNNFAQRDWRVKLQNYVELKSSLYESSSNHRAQENAIDVAPKDKEIDKYSQSSTESSLYMENVTVSDGHDIQLTATHIGISTKLTEMTSEMTTLSIVSELSSMSHGTESSSRTSVVDSGTIGGPEGRNGFEDEASGSDGREARISTSSQRPTDEGEGIASDSEDDTKTVTSHVSGDSDSTTVTCLPEDNGQDCEDHTLQSPTTPLDVVPVTSNPTNATDVTVPTEKSSTEKTDEEMSPREPETPAPPEETPPPPKTSFLDSVMCSFGTYPQQTLCGWSNSNNSALNWKTGSGKEANWVGGPLLDVDVGDNTGGYAFVETSRLNTLEGLKSQGALLLSPQLKSTGAQGTCFSFSYVVNGLSAKEIRVILQPLAPPAAPSLVTGALKNEVLWEDDSRIRGEWEEEQVLYTYRNPHRLVIEALPVEADNPSRRYRGYVAVDNLRLQEGIYCQSFCTFSAGFCDWNNEPVDDFDWSLSRGGDNPLTGPSTGRYTVVGGSMKGGYAFIDSSYPRRTGDTARLASATFPATGENPLCMKFWFHMYGEGIGALRIFLRRFALQIASSPNKDVWRLSGNAGNSWYMGQVTVSSIYDFQVVIEGSVGLSGLGNIAIDDITFSHGPCASFPQAAGIFPGVCTFESDYCEWISKSNDVEVLWERVPDNSQNERFRRRPAISSDGTAKNGFFLQLSRHTLLRPGSGARLISKLIPGSDEPICLTFWFFMYEPFIDVSGPSLGALRVLLNVVSKKGARVMDHPVWELYNHQGEEWTYAQVTIHQPLNYNVIFEGTWGPNRASGLIAMDDIIFYEGNCKTRPKNAKVHVADCHFDSGACGWHNWTKPRLEEKFVSWQIAQGLYRPNHLEDRTFGTAGGFIFFDVFTTNGLQKKVWLMSPTIDSKTNGGTKICLTFWIAAFGVGHSTRLSVIVLEEGLPKDPDNGRKVWSITGKGMDTTRPNWIPGQVKLEYRKPFTVFFEGEANNGGFAVDDIELLSRSCTLRPREAAPSE